jgi:hypothetical protein
VDLGQIDTAELFHRISQLRHVAVHRVPTPNSIISHEMIPDALLITTGVRDMVRHNKLLVIQKAFEACRGSTPNLRSLEGKSSHMDAFNRTFTNLNIEILGIESTVSADNKPRSISLKRDVIAAAELPAKRTRVSKSIFLVHLIQLDHKI